MYGDYTLFPPILFTPAPTTRTEDAIAWSVGGYFGTKLKVETI